LAGIRITWQVEGMGMESPPDVTFFSGISEVNTQGINHKKEHPGHFIAWGRQQILVYFDILQEILQFLLEMAGILNIQCMGSMRNFHKS